MEKGTEYFAVICINVPTKKERKKSILNAKYKCRNGCIHLLTEPI